jgi:hypothetical protein
MGKKVYVGIDPGASGSATAIDEDGKIVSTLRFAKATEKEIWEWFNGLNFDYDAVCVKEKVWAMPATDSEGVARKMGAQTMFVFGDGNGFIRCCLVASYIPFTEAVPQTWQKFFGMKREKTESQTDYKRKLKQKAEELFPNQKITNDMADSMLISVYCRKINNQK